jgi:hypothetical protein
MALISGIAPEYTAWHKWKLGWLDDDQIACVAPDSDEGSSTFTLSAIETSGGDGSKAVVVPVNETVAIVAEARTTLGEDGEVCSPGVLIYAVYMDLLTGEGPMRVFDSTPNSGGCAGDELNDAPYNDGTFEEVGVTIDVGSMKDNSWDVTVKNA